MLFHQIEPVATPGNVPADLAISGHIHRHRFPATITGHIRYRYFAGFMQRRAHYADRRFNAMSSGLQLPQIGKAYHHADSSVPAHAQISDIVKKDNAGIAGGVVRFAEQRADQNIRPARLIHNSRAKRIMLLAKALQPISQRAAAEVWTARKHQPGRLSSCMRINYFHALHALSCWHKSVMSTKLDTISY